MTPIFKAEDFAPHAPDMCQTCTRHAPDMRQTCPRHAPDMPQTCTRHAPDMRSADMRSADMRSANMRSADMCSADMCKKGDGYDDGYEGDGRDADDCSYDDGVGYVSDDDGDHDDDGYDCCYDAVAGNQRTALVDTRCQAPMFTSYNILCATYSYHSGEVPTIRVKYVPLG